MGEDEGEAAKMRLPVVMEGASAPKRGGKIASSRKGTLTSGFR